jgi:DNA-binding NtrC family response regulator
MLAAHSWPGNVRELQNVIRNVVVLNDGELVTPDMLPPQLRLAAGTMPRAPAPARPAPALAPAAIRPLADCEREIIEAAIEACAGNMTEAAKRLGISSKTIYRKRQEWAPS